MAKSPLWLQLTLLLVWTLKTWKTSDRHSFWYQPWILVRQLTLQLILTLNTVKLIPVCKNLVVYSADTQTVNVMALFSLYLYFCFTYFVVIFLYFYRTNQSHLWTKAIAQTFFLLSFVFLLFHATCLRCFSVRGYTCIPNKLICVHWSQTCVFSSPYDITRT